MNNFFLILLIPFFLCCRTEQSEKRKALKISACYNTEKQNSVHIDAVIDSGATGLNFIPTTDYSAVKNEIESERLQFQKRYLSSQSEDEKKQIADSSSAYLTNAILNKLIPFWYGTPWDFNGYTEKPGTGSVACGYFVSTTLKHAGFRLNRFKMAQQAGYHEALTLEPDSALIIIDNQPDLDLSTISRKLLNELNDGLYFIGLSCHVGYLYVNNGDLYFLHSNYIDGKVMIENAAYSNAFRSSIYVVADITHNNRLIKQWILGEEIPVVIP